jgi:hypothetical protein
LGLTIDFQAASWAVALRKPRLHYLLNARPNEVVDGANQIMLYPLPDERLQVARHQVCVSSDSGNRHGPPINTYVDAFGNTVGVFTVLEPHTVLVIESLADVTTHPI